MLRGFIVRSPKLEVNILKHRVSSIGIAARFPHRKVAAMAASQAADVYHMGNETLRISRKTMHGSIRNRLVEALRPALSAKGIAPGFVLLQGGGPFNVYNTDGELIFKQESFMHYLFGVCEEDCYGAVDIRMGASFLFMPRLPEAYAVWMGSLKSTDEYKAMYAVDHVHYTDEMASVLAKHGAKEGAKPGPLHVMNGVNTDSGRPATPAQFEGADAFELDNSTTLFDTITACRVKKTPEEAACLRYANQVGSGGHVAMMRAAKPGMMEYQLESVFLHHCYFHGGCRITGYTPISASGPNGAILHYGHASAPNNRQTREGDMMLMDMGCEYYRYGSDITTSWPVSGKFTPQQATIYNGVLKAYQSVKATMKPGVSWPDMQTLAYRTILDQLVSAGLLSGPVDDLLNKDIGALFMPHGLGHMLGLDTHDVGGYLPGTPPRSQRPGYKSMRTARILEPDMVITLEPGCYFNPSLLLPAFEDPVKSPHLVRQAIEPFMSFGGVRLEDNILITETGCEVSFP
ncbi:Xaa-Pro dipeptidase (X-Pro dipeptidase) [Dunaliella salina]|uniref:Xaa-Pro dipeptidase n=1 Tax=Dunaliella salina TaxID=3046 RepID=A0ABQ7GGF0_DUNSA|nr:Xaa-Pro dipeptidase (X-Pro dipeptidase) [Dunaliella salina]|eukprot:KAF5833683.1 Xaa-Pro dipeptidase (X-Pro dipeptidase) [Dunaliella salina]